MRKNGNQQTKKTMRMMTSVLAALMLSLSDSFLKIAYRTVSYKICVELSTTENIVGSGWV